jgi:hypothetical protein
MTIVKSVFYRCSAWVGRIDGETRCAFWSRHPAEVNYDPLLLIPIDLSRTPAAARKGKIDWDEVQLDDFRDDLDDDGMSTVGPWFPDGKTTGVIYLEKSYIERLREEIRPAFPPPGTPARDYELMSVVYRDGTGNARAGLRYQGFHARIDSRDGSKILVHHGGRSLAKDPPVECALDLGSLDCDAHEDDGGMTRIGHGKGKQREGALFIKVAVATGLNIRGGKEPLGHLIGTGTPASPHRFRGPDAGLQEAS